jgi:hypothetical protein
MGLNSGSNWRGRGAKEPNNRRLFHCFVDVHVPVQPSDRLNVETWPELVTMMPPRQNTS